MPVEEPMVRGTPQERERYWEVMRHYSMAKDDLDDRIPDWNKKDELFRSHINQKGWPYSAQVFDPRVFTAIFEKSARLLANKPRGRMLPREGGDTLGAKINNELLSFQWDEAERVDGTPMLGKWALMDMNARKYGASFALCKWHYEERIQGERKTRITWFDGPTFKPWNNRDVLHNPSYSTIKNWIQLREYVTLNELKTINDAARSKPIYKNLDILQNVVSKENVSGGDTRSTNWVSKNLSIKGLQDHLGRDPVFKVLEIVTEYRPDRWITFSPKHGVILRDIPNPYLHGQIPVVMLKYYPIDEDLYGLSEIEPIEKLQKATNALICQYLDAINMSLYTPIKVRTGGAVQVHTLEFGPGKKWLMSDPVSDVLPYQISVNGVTEFTATYRFMVGAMQEALGETSAAISNLVPGEGEKTATEIRELSLQRNVRDNFNQMFLAEALKDQMMLWHQMNQQLLFSNERDKKKIIRIVGQDAIDFFEQTGLAGEGLTEEAINQITSPEMDDVIANPNFDINNLLQPLFPVETKEGVIPKFVVEEGKGVGHLIIEPEDLSGNYDYIPEVRSMEAPDMSRLQVLRQMIDSAKDPITLQILLQDGYKLRLRELLEDFFETLGLKEADKYFEKVTPGIGGEQVGPIGQQALPGGAESPQASRAIMGPEELVSMAGGTQTLAA